MFGLISKKKLIALEKQLEESFNRETEANKVYFNNEIQNKEISIKNLQEEVKKQLEIIQDYEKQLSELNVFEVEKELSAIQIKEFGEDGKTLTKEACIEELLESVKNKVEVKEETNYGTYVVTTKLTIK